MRLRLDQGVPKGGGHGRPGDPLGGQGPAAEPGRGDGLTGRTLVVCALGGEADDPLALPGSSFSDRYIRGGERTLYEIAVAAAARGWDVELRGILSEADLRSVADAVGASPRTGLEPRRPEASDVVLLPEGYRDALPYARVALSPAHGVIVLLAPPGLFGWAFDEGWRAPPDPTTVDPLEVGDAGLFRRMVAAGFSLWTTSVGIQRDAVIAGVACAFIGGGWPGEMPEVPEKRVDVAMVDDNRWSDSAREVAGELGSDVDIDVIERVDHAEMLRRLGAARVLLWPSRVEGHARIQIEARMQGTVPVCLSSNRFAEGLDESGGAVPVASVDQMAPAIRTLLGDPARLEDLRHRAIRSAREQVDWRAFVERVAAALDLLPLRSEAPFSRIVRSLLDVPKADANRLRARNQDLQARNLDLHGWIEELHGEIDRLRGHGDDLAKRIEMLEREEAAVRQEYERLTRRRSVRAVLRAGALRRRLTSRHRRGDEGR